MKLVSRFLGIFRFGRRMERGVAAAKKPVAVARAPLRALAPPRRVLKARAAAHRSRLWQDRKWVVTTGLADGVPAAQYKGFYQTARGRRYSGLIVETQHDTRSYIYQPPLDDIRVYTGHDQCFHKCAQLGDGWYWIHMSDPSRSVDEALFNLEVLLNECENRAGWPNVNIDRIIRTTARAL